VVFAHFFKRGALWTKLFLVGSTIPIAIFVNAFRVALTGYLSHHFGEEAAGGVLHDFQGIFTFGLAFFILLGEGRLIDLGLHVAGRRAETEHST
jgi:exosortase/archaeosortase family protein